MNFPGGIFGLPIGGGGPQVPEEIIEDRPEGMDKETAARLYTNGRSDGYYARGRSDKLPGEQEIFEIYEAGFVAGEYSRKVDLANSVEIEDPRDQPQPEVYPTFSDAPLDLKIRHILQNHTSEVGGVCLIAVSASATLFLLKKTIVD